MSFGITAQTPIATLAQSSILDVLKGAQLVVYLRLVAAVALQGTYHVSVINSELHRNRNGRTAAVALRELSDIGLIKVRHGRKTIDRKIEVLP
jgi:hypothetical protein